MESFILLFKPYRAWLSLLVCGLLLTQQGWGQLYSTHYDTPKLQYLDLATQTWTNKAVPPERICTLVTYQGKIYAEPGYSNKFYVYDPATDTWAEKAPKPVSSYFGRMVVVGQYIYYVAGGGGGAFVFYRYNLTNNTWTIMATPPGSQLIGSLAYNGGDYIYFGTRGYSGSLAPLLRYSISGNSWVTMPTPTSPADLSYWGMAFKNDNLYLNNAYNHTFYSYDPATSTYTSLSSPLADAWVLESGDGNYLYSSASNGINRYDISTNTWTNLTGTVSSYSLLYLTPPCSVTGTVTATSVTCANLGGANADAALTLTAHGGGATKVGYSAGSSYTGPDFATATAATTAPMVLSNTLTNPSAPQPYTIRLFQNSTCYKDVVATLAPTLCLTSDLSLSLSPVTQIGTKGEQLTYTVTLTNAGPDTASNVQIDVKVPTNATLLTASPQVGTYSEATHKWDISTLPVGSQTLTVTLKMN